VERLIAIVGLEVVGDAARRGEEEGERLECGEQADGSGVRARRVLKRLYATGLRQKPVLVPCENVDGADDMNAADRQVVEMAEVVLSPVTK
jgi:hypothetical protein